MSRLLRSVKPTEWSLSSDLDTRRGRLIDAVGPAELLVQVATEASVAAGSRSLPLCWQESTDDGRDGYFRLSGQVPLSEVTFDQVFNGNAGYRAQYCLSPEEGILYNRDIIQALLPAVKLSYDSQPVRATFEMIRRSLEAPHSKIWIFNEIAAFDAAQANTINPLRWVANNATRGRKAPLPSHLMVDLKGAFLNFANDDLHVNDMKLDRACDLFLQGYT